MRQFGGIVLLATGASACALVYFCRVPEQIEFLRDLTGFFGIASILVGAMLLSIKDRF
jgi:hypothetical protein